MKYSVKPMSLDLAPYESRLNMLLLKTPENIDEANKISVEIKQLREKILAELVSPSPRPEHSVRLYCMIQQLTKHAMAEAGLFRDEHGDSAEGGAVSSSAAQASQ
ncbi:MAG: hypothetical protein NWE99_10960 [Candidatus Bathyarchaeota archaeon]|nr:hypothetical protein [Candidatus Bathyarchaeota archaeon]